jgi:hypothetical protein
MVKYKLFTTSIVVMTLVILVTGCKKTTTEETFEPQVLINKLSVKVVPQGTENIIVSATDEHNASLTFSVECDDEDIATVTKTDSTITVTGKSYGTTNIKISCDTDSTLNKTFPVEVYDPKIIEAGELLIAFVDTFEYRWKSEGSSQGEDGSFYHPVLTDSFHALGSIGFTGFSNPNGNKGVLVVKAKPGSDALKPPVYYDFVWNSQGTGADDEGSFWNPIPPAGYKALGTVAQQGYDEPSVNDVVCVREDLVVEGALGGEFFWGVSTGPKRFKSCLIDPPDAGPHDSCYLSTGTFVGTEYEPQPPSYPVLYVLKVMLPMMAEGADQSFAPKLTGYDTPPDKTAPLMSKEMSVPWSIVKDSRWSSIERLAKSPKYRLEREVYYQLMYHNYNQTSELQTNSLELKSGASRTESDNYWEETDISITREWGVSLVPWGVGSSYKHVGTVSESFGYETQTSITELQEKTITSSINTHPGKAAALWQKYNRFTLKRHNGTRLETVGSWEFGIDSYITDEYPHDK